MSRLMVALVVLAMTGCASHWKILGGPPECRAMCDRWGLKFVGMVGVGSQDPHDFHGQGATACVCLDPEVAKGAVAGAGGSSASLSAPIAAATQAAAAAVHEQGRQHQGH